MSDLLKADFSRFDLATGLKVLAGLIAVFGLTAVTDQPWMATGLVVLFGWMTDLPGKLEYRLFGVVAFGVGAALITLVADALGTGAPAGTVLIFVVGLLGSLLLANGTRPYMVGYVLICWAIYGPALATETSVGNVLLAIFVGTAILVAIICAFAWLKSQPDDQIPDEAPGQSSRYTAIYAITIAVVLAVAAYLGHTQLKTNPAVVVGACFFVIGFDARQSWMNGIARLIGVVAGGLIGFYLARWVADPALVQLLVLAAGFLAFATMAMHPGALMFFLTMMGGFGWTQLAPDQLDLVAGETLIGEGIGIAMAMATVIFLQKAQERFAGTAASDPNADTEIN